MEHQLEPIRVQGAAAKLPPSYYGLAGHLVERTAPSSGDAVLAVGSGAGSIAIGAARRGADVVGVDCPASALERHRHNADIAGVTVDWRAGDVGDLPAERNAFDLSLSATAHVHEQSTEAWVHELRRVTRSDGHLGIIAWTPTSLVAFLTSVLETYRSADEQPPPSGDPFAWGDSDEVRNRLGPHVDRVSFAADTVRYPVLSPAHFLAEIVDPGGGQDDPLAGLDEENRSAVRTELLETIRPYFDDRENAVELEYLLTIARL